MPADKSFLELAASPRLLLDGFLPSRRRHGPGRDTFRRAAEFCPTEANGDSMTKSQYQKPSGSRSYGFPSISDFEQSYEVAACLASWST